eukprot:1855796-Amphidinium_carterae.1
MGVSLSDQPHTTSRCVSDCIEPAMEAPLLKQLQQRCPHEHLSDLATKRLASGSEYRQEAVSVFV